MRSGGRGSAAVRVCPACDGDGDCAVAACGGDQASDGPAGGGLQPAGHGKGSRAAVTDDGQVGLDGLAQVVWGVPLCGVSSGGG